MLRALLLLAVLGAIAAAGAWVPIHGKTILERWRAAPDATAFAARGLDEVKTAVGLGATKPARATAPRPHGSRQSRAIHPTETHTDRDRAELDRILADADRR